MQNKKSSIIKKIFIIYIVEYLIAALITLLIMAYQNNYEQLGFINGLQVAGALLFIAGWFVFINHHGVFDVFTYSLKSFFKSFTKEPRMKKSLLEQRLEKKKMPAYLFLSFWLNGIIIIIISFIIFNYNQTPNPDTTFVFSLISLINGYFV